MKFKLIIFIAISSFFLSSCDIKPGTTGGGIMGMLLGGTACANFVDGKAKIFATLGCAIAGGLFGAWVGSKWDETDEKEVISVLDTSKDGEVMSWKNPDTYNQFKMTSLKTSTNSAGQQCRQFKISVNGNSPENRNACRDKNGKWKFS
jgi:surface antigen